MFEFIDQIATEHLEQVNVKEEYIAACCPFHSEGKERSPSFWLERETGRWGCFACGQGGEDLRSLLKGLGVRSAGIEATLEEIERERKKVWAREKVRREKRSRARLVGVHRLP